MPITPDDVDRIATLARLEFTPEERERLLAELNVMLAHIATLDEVDTSGLEPLTGFADESAPPRLDEARPSPPAEEMLRNAPDRAGSHFRVPNVMGDRS